MAIGTRDTPPDDGLEEALADGGVWAHERGKQTSRLAVFVHGYATTPRTYTGLLRKLHDLGMDVFAPAYDAGPFGSAKPGEVTKALALAIASKARG